MLWLNDYVVWVCVNFQGGESVCVCGCVHVCVMVVVVHDLFLMIAHQTLTNLLAAGVSNFMPARLAPWLTHGILMM